MTNLEVDGSKTKQVRHFKLFAFQPSLLDTALIMPGQNLITLCYIEKQKKKISMLMASMICPQHGYTSGYIREQGIHGLDKHLKIHMLMTMNL